MASVIIHSAAIVIGGAGRLQERYVNPDEHERIFGRRQMHVVGDGLRRDFSLGTQTYG
jgi:hypothetical protein